MQPNMDRLLALIRSRRPGPTSPREGWDLLPWMTAWPPHCP